MQNYPTKQRGTGLTEVLVTLVIASVTMLALLRMHVMTSIFAEQQRLLTLARIALDDLNQRLLLVEPPQAGAKCDGACSLAYSGWTDQWRKLEPRFSTVLLDDEAGISVEIAWPVHPLVPNNPACVLDGACSKFRLYP